MVASCDLLLLILMFHVSSAHDTRHGSLTRHREIETGGSTDNTITIDHDRRTATIQVDRILRTLIHQQLGKAIQRQTFATQTEISFR
jgi:hypothetical protein